MATRIKKTESKKEPTLKVTSINNKHMWYPVDWDKVKTLSDMKIIFSNMGLGCATNSSNYNEVKKYLSKNGIVLGDN